MIAQALALALLSSAAARSCYLPERGCIATAQAFVSPAAQSTGRAHRPLAFANRRIVGSTGATSRTASVAAAAAPKRSQLDVRWDSRFNELKQYKGEHGDCNVPRREGPLGTWVINQRSSYNKGTLSQERIKQLESIGFTWNPLEEDWVARFNDLKQYKDEHDNCNVNTQTGGPFGWWVDRQRRSYKKGTLSPERIEQLEIIGFAWDPLEEEWKARYTELIKYKDEHGDCNVNTDTGGE